MIKYIFPFLFFRWTIGLEQEKKKLENVETPKTVGKKKEKKNRKTIEERRLFEEQKKKEEFFESSSSKKQK